MKTKSLSFRLFITLLVITSVAMALLQLISCKQTGGTCTYKGLECPNALAIYQQDSLAYADCEFVADSLANANDSLQTIITAYEQKDHSQIPTVAGAGMIHLRHDQDGAIELVYREHDGNEFFLDYAIDNFSTDTKYNAHAKR